MRKIARSTQLQGVNAPFFPSRNPEPWHCAQLCMASTSVSERVQSIALLYPLNCVVDNLIPPQERAPCRYSTPSPIECQLLNTNNVLFMGNIVRDVAIN